MISAGCCASLAFERIRLHAPDEVAAAFGPAAVRLASGGVIPAVTAVLSCRGTVHGPTLSFLPPSAQAALFAAGDGAHLFRHLVHPDVPQVAFVTAGQTLALGTSIHLQATWLVASGRGA